VTSQIEPSGPAGWAYSSLSIGRAPCSYNYLVLPPATDFSCQEEFAGLPADRSSAKSGPGGSSYVVTVVLRLLGFGGQILGGRLPTIDRPEDQPNH
jgi:hypothetical protein